MSTFQLFGPLTITHDSVDQGKTSGGASIRLLSVTREPVGDDYDVEEVVYGADGTIRSYEHGATALAYGRTPSTLDLTDYGELILDSDYGTVTLHNAKLSLPTMLNFGTFEYRTVDLRITAKEDATGKVITLTPK